MKKEFTEYVFAIGGEARYSGKEKIMYVHGIEEHMRKLLIISEEGKFPFKVVFQ